jgi:hypothetical protein
VFSPIENAIEVMEKMNAKMKAEINATPINIKSLQGLLQGSILAGNLKSLISEMCIYSMGSCE